MPPSAWLTLPVEPDLPLPLFDWDSFFARAVFSFLADFSLDFAELCFGLSEGFGDAFATSAFFGVDFGIGFDVTFGFAIGVAVGFEGGVAVGVGFGVDNSISLLVVTAGFSSLASSSFDGFC